MGFPRQGVFKDEVKEEGLRANRDNRTIKFNVAIHGNNVSIDSVKSLRTMENQESSLGDGDLKVK